MKWEIDPSVLPQGCGVEVHHIVKSPLIPTYPELGHTIDKCIIILSIDVLERWEVPPINEVNRKLERIERAIKRQDEAIDEVRYVLKLVVTS